MKTTHHQQRAISKANADVYRLFPKEYNMSPADYRNGAKGMNATS